MTTGEFIYEVTKKNPRAMCGIVPANKGTEWPTWHNTRYKEEPYWLLYIFDIFSRFHGYMDLTGAIYFDIERNHLIDPGTIV